MTPFRPASDRVAFLRRTDGVLAIEFLDLDPTAEPDWGDDGRDEYVCVTEADGTPHPYMLAYTGLLGWHDANLGESDEDFIARVGQSACIRGLEMQLDDPSPERGREVEALGRALLADRPLDTGFRLC